MNVCAVILAAGSGSRMGLNIKKQFIDFHGKPLIAHTISVFEEIEEIDEIVLVVSLEDFDYVKNDIVNKYQLKKVKHIVSGSSTRQESVFEGMKKANESNIVLIHDGARPFVTKKIILESINDANIYGASCVAVREKNTTKIINDEGFIVKTLNRNYVYQAQTPQTFKTELFLKASKKALENGFIATDDVSLVEELGHSVKITNGDYRNIKITTKEDLEIAKQMFKEKLL